VIGRAENKALVEYLGLDLEVLPDDYDANLETRPVALIDTQPSASNNPLPEGYAVTIVIDHHRNLESSGSAFADVRPWIGASSTILTQYLKTAEVKPTTKIATALFYGIKTDTKSLSRDTSAADVTAYFYLLNFVDIDAFVEIENAQVPPSYFRTLARAMQAARIYDGVVFAYVGYSDYPDLTAELADMFLRLEGVTWVICAGAFDEHLYLSVRARADNVDAEELAKHIIGNLGAAGGRGNLAGGQIPLEGRDPQALANELRKRTLRFLDVAPDTEGHTLI
jgi:nanoRNase/pAp phosphatase (c-di-AMP/oligoRNAs hydrolase)